MPQLILGEVEEGIGCGHAMCSNCRVTGTIEWTLKALMAACVHAWPLHTEHGSQIYPVLRRQIYVYLNNGWDCWRT